MKEVVVAIPAVQQILQVGSVRLLDKLAVAFVAVVDAVSNAIAPIAQWIAAAAETRQPNLFYFLVVVVLVMQVDAARLQSITTW